MSNSSPAHSSHLNVLPDGWRGSTRLNSTINTYSDVAHRVKLKLGYPKIAVELTDEQFAAFIDEAVELFTQYAGYTEEHIVWCTTQYQRGLGLRLDRIFNYQCYPTPGLHQATTYEITSTTTTEISSLTVTALVSSVPTLTGGNICLTYDPSDVWSFDVCSMDQVSLSAAVYSETTVCETTALITASNGVATIYSADYAALAASACPPPLSAYWGCGVDVSNATWIHITGLPPCTLLGDNPIAFNNGKYVTISLCNTALDTRGPVIATVAFKIGDRTPTEILDTTYDISANTGGGFKVCFDAGQCVPYMSSWGTVNATFSAVSTTNNYGYTCKVIPDLADANLDHVRKVVQVRSVDRGGTFGGIGENYLYGMDYALAQNLWGGTQTSLSLNNRGFDFITYELLAQFIEMGRRMLARPYTWIFNPDTQYLRLSPEPRTPTTSGCLQCKEECFVMTCYIERPIAYVIKERWVLDYVLASVMVALGHVRGKFGNITLFGGGTINASDVMTQGLELREKLREELLNGVGTVPPPLFLMG